MELEQIEGTVEDIIYENPDNGYTVFEISGGGTVTVVCGIVGELHAGESVVCRGKYENHARMAQGSLKGASLQVADPDRAGTLPRRVLVSYSCVLHAPSGSYSA